jgi:thiol-disulfide isomerase/thioredoxin
MMKRLIASVFLLASGVCVAGEEQLKSNSALENFRTRYAVAKMHRAFAQSPDGAWAWSSKATSVQQAIDAAARRCTGYLKPDGRPCVVIHVDDDWTNPTEQVATKEHRAPPMPAQESGVAAARTETRVNAGEEQIKSNTALSSFRTEYAAAAKPKAFVQSPVGAWSWRSDRTSEQAIDTAIRNCTSTLRPKDSPCVVIHVDDDWIPKKQGAKREADGEARTLEQVRMPTFTNENLKHEIEKSKGLLLVHFSSNDRACKPCESSNKKIDELARGFRRSVPVLFARITWESLASMNRDIKAQYNLTDLPTLILFQDGKEYFRITSWDKEKEKGLVDTFLVYDQRIHAERAGMLVLTDENLKKTIETSKGRLVVHLSSYDRGCGYCDLSNASVERLVPEYRGAVQFARITWEPWGNMNREIVERYKVGGLPALILFNDGKEEFRIVGWSESIAKETKNKLDKCCKR